MSVTRLELQKWLDQFPEDAVIQVITTEEGGRGGFMPYTSVYETDLVLQQLPEDFISYFEGETFEVEKLRETMTIRLGKKGQ
jgi:hypothetical protein